MNTTSPDQGNDAGQQSSPSPEDHLHNLQEDAQAALASAKEHGSAQFEQYRDTAADQIESLAQTAQSAVEQMQGSDTLGLSHYVTDIAQNMTTLAGNLRGKSVDELLHQAGQLARDNPALFITGSVALGFGLSRFLKASSTGESSATAKSSPVGQTSEQFKSQSGSGMSSVVTADQEFPTSYPHMADVHHSGKPESQSTSTGSAGSAFATDPLGSEATYPDTKDDLQHGFGSTQKADDLARSGQPTGGYSKGDM